jgi:hypothetical protein
MCKNNGMQVHICACLVEHISRRLFSWPCRKTLQVIALVWTLLRQGPQGRPAVRRGIVVTPSSLTGALLDGAPPCRACLGLP